MRDLIVRAPRTPRRLHWHCGTFAASWGTSFPRSAISAVGGNRTFSTESALSGHALALLRCLLLRVKRTYTRHALMAANVPHRTSLFSVPPLSLRAWRESLERQR